MEETKYLPYANLFLRITLALTLLSAVADRLGLWGEPDTQNVMWGSWFAYEGYVHQLIPFLSEGFSDKLALAVTVLEIALGAMLLFGVKVRWAAIGTGTLTMLLAITISMATGIKEPINKAMFVVSAASFLLACTPVYRWTLNGIKKRTVYKPY
ncbi:DoxX family membrane protein [Pontibacter locisalis]|uniref:DoxX family membrane protein n=1 Tax=Pontibacter locisalis TaxID=1719035 RepID=A0ABW5IK52_9BACT